MTDKRKRFPLHNGTHPQHNTALTLIYREIERTADQRQKGDLTLDELIVVYRRCIQELLDMGRPHPLNERLTGRRYHGILALSAFLSHFPEEWTRHEKIL